MVKNKLLIGLLALVVLKITGYCDPVTSATKSLRTLDSSRALTEYDSALVALVEQRYDVASVLITKCIAKKPSNIDALYFSFAIQQTRILDYESYLVENKQFQQFADSIRVILEQRLPGLHGTDSLRGLFYLANVYGGIGIMQAKTGNWFDAARNAVTSVSMLKQVCKSDPDFYAAYLGIGVFQYYLRNSFKWLPFVDEKKDDGVEIIEKALKAEFPYDYAAKNSLCWILIEQQQYKKADSLAQSVLDVYPNNTIFLRIRMMSALWTQHYDLALQFAKRMMPVTLERDPRNWSDFVVVYAVVANCYKEKQDFPAMKKNVEFLLSQPVPGPYTAIPHIKRYLKQMQEFNQKYKNVKSK